MNARRLLLLVPAIVAIGVLASVILQITWAAPSDGETQALPTVELASVSTPSQPTTAPTPAVPLVDIWDMAAPIVPGGKHVFSQVNLGNIVELSRLGDGWPSSTAWSPDGSILAIGTALGVDLYASEDGRHGEKISTVSPVLSVAYSPDGKWIAAGQMDGRIILINPQTGLIAMRLVFHTHSVRGLAFSRPEKAGSSSALLASGDEDGTIIVWDLATGNLRFQFSNPLFGYWGYGIRSLAFSPLNRILATGGDQGYVALWNMSTGKELPHLQSQHGLVFSIAFSPDGAKLASACGDGSVQMWDFASGTALFRMTGHEYGAWSVAYSPDGTTIATGAGDGMVRLWNAQNGAALRERAVFPTQVDSLAFSTDGSRLAAVSIGESARVVNTENLEPAFLLRQSFGGIRSASFSPDGVRAVLAGENGNIYVWDTTKGGLSVMETGRPAGNAGMAAILSPDGATLVVADGSQNNIRLLDPGSFSLHSTEQVRGVRAAAYSPGGAYLAAGGLELLVYETASGRTQRLDLPAAVTSLAFPQIPGTGRMFLAAGTENGSLLLWDLTTGESRELYADPGNPVWSLAAQGSVLAAGDNLGGIHVWDISLNRLLWEKAGNSANSIFSVSISSDGAFLASAGREAVIRLWDLRYGRLLASLKGHNGWIYGVAFSPDDSWLLSAGTDGSARIWGVKP